MKALVMLSDADSANASLMREVHHTCDAEDDRQTDRDQKQRSGAGQSGNCLGDDEAHKILQRHPMALWPHGANCPGAAS